MADPGISQKEEGRRKKEEGRRVNREIEIFPISPSPHRTLSLSPDLPISPSDHLLISPSPALLISPSPHRTLADRSSAPFGIKGFNSFGSY
jgi:hypothetical protein